MIRIKRKIVNNKPFYYLTERLSVNNISKKIQAYIGKSVPKDISLVALSLSEKEAEIWCDSLPSTYELERHISIPEYEKLETIKTRMKYIFWLMSEKERERFWRRFAISFIFESNAIEGSKLSEKEVDAIVGNGYVKKSLDRKEIREVLNSMKVFELIRSGAFSLNQRSIINLHAMLVDGLGIEMGYKQNDIIVNNKETVKPGSVRPAMKDLLDWYKEQKRNKRHPFELALDFHNRFEFIHPFADGNGRVGRIILNWMLLSSGYGPLLIRNKNRRSYFSALDQADEGRAQKLYRFGITTYQKTYNDFFLKYFM